MLIYISRLFIDAFRVIGTFALNVKQKVYLYFKFKRYNAKNAMCKWWWRKQMKRKGRGIPLGFATSVWFLIIRTQFGVFFFGKITKYKKTTLFTFTKVCIDAEIAIDICACLAQKFKSQRKRIRANWKLRIFRFQTQVKIYY